MADGKVVIETDLDSSGIQAGLSKLSSIARSSVKGTLTSIASAGTALAGLGSTAIKIGADFEAGMSEVQAIARASASDMELLKEKAKEMGAETKFSATESAAAFKYMAQAGWSTEDMLNGISGVMSLAAASGEDLALTADIVTDSLTAFGLEAKDAAHFSDVLAMTANATNTDVANLGYTFKYVAPVAGALGYSIEDMSVAIGLMANSGIKAETAGTALRTTLTNLAKPTQQMTGYMEELGISLTDAQGNVKPFNEVMIDLREGFEGLTEAQKAEYAAGIAGKEAMSGLLAIVNASDEDFAALTAQINNCNGAAEEAAKIMQDNLKGSVEQLGGALETLGIEFYESVDTPIRTIVDSATSMVDQLTKAFKDGGLSGLVSELGTVFAEVATQAANSAPKMIDAATSMITSFLDGISQNSGQISNAAVKIGESLINGIAQIIPRVAEVGVEIVASLISNLLGSDVGRSVEELGKTIIDSFKTIASAVSGALNSLKPAFSTFISTVSNIAKAVIPPLTKVIEICISALKPMAPILLGVAGGFTALKIVKTVTGLIKKFTETEIVSNTITTIQNGLLWAKIAATEVLTGKITLAQAAQQLWNIAMGQNPIGAVVTAIGVFVGVLSGLAAALSGTNSEYQNAVNSLNDLKEAHEEVRSEQQKALEADFKEIDQINVLKTELDKLVDSNGKIKDGYLDRATAIAGELAEATGLEIEIIDGQIQKYGELGESIDAVITKKQMAALTDSLQEISDHAESQLDEARAYLETVTKAYNDAQAAYDRAKEYAERTGDDSKLGSLERDLKNKQAEMEKQIALVDSLREDIAMGTEALAVSASGDAKVMSDFMTRVSVKVDETGKAIIQSEASTYAERERLASEYRDMAERTTDQYLKDLYIKQAEELERQNAQMDSSLGIQIALIDSKGEQFNLSYAALMDKAAEGITNGGVGVDLAMQENMLAIVTAITNAQLPVEEQTRLLADLQTQVFQNNAPNVGAAEQSTMQSVLDAIYSTNPGMASAVQALVNAGIFEMENGKIGFSDKAKEMGLDGNETLRGYISEFETTSKNIAVGAAAGVKAGAWNFIQQAEDMAKQGLKNFKHVLGITSPSKEFIKASKWIPEGAAQGVKNNAKIATDAISAMANDMTSEYEASLDDFTTTGIKDAFDKLPEQEIKLVGLLEKIKGLDATALMDKARAAVYANQTAVAGAAVRSSYMINTGMSQSANSGGDRQTVINFNQPVESPDATARAINRIFTFGLAGDKG
jgi:TP901 family phage tail tape measure protein